MATCGPSLSCCPFAINRAVHIAAQNLPAAGALLTPTLEVLPAGTKEVVFWVTYTRRGPTGYPGARVEWSNGTEESLEPVLDLSSFAAAAPLGDTNIYVNELLGIAPADDNPLSWVLPFKAPAGVVGVRFIVREVGAVANPGTIAVAITGAGGGGW